MTVHKRNAIFAAGVILFQLFCFGQPARTTDLGERDWRAGGDTACNIIWYPPIQLSDSTHNAYQPRIALSGDDTVHVTWGYGTHFGVRLPYIRSTLSGKFFEPIKELLIDSMLFPYQALFPDIIARHNRVWIFFTGATESYPPIYMITSSSGGSDWSAVVAITTERSAKVYSSSQYIDNVALVYPPHIINDQPPKILRSTNSGTNWTRTDENLDDYAKIALTSGSLHLVQHTWRPPAVEINYRRSSNLGDTWEIDTVISDVDGYYSDLPTIAGYTSECGTELLAAWRDVKYGVFGFLGASIISRASLSGGLNWLPEVLLTPEPKYSEPQAAVNGNTRAVGLLYEAVAFDTLHVAVTGTNSSLTRYCPVKDLTPFTEGSRDAGNQSVAVSSHAIHVVYEQLVGSTFRIFYRRGEFIQKDVNFSLSTGLITANEVEVNTTTTDTVWVSNSGTDTLIIGTAISDNENFTVTPTEGFVPPSGSTAFEIRITPRTLGEHSGKIIFYHNGRTSPDCISVTTVGKWREETISYQSGWNLVSIPLLPGPVQRLPQMFGYENGYVKRDTMLLGIGYWAKPESTGSVIYQGIGVWSDTFNVRARWNIIGSLTAPVPVSSITTIPSGIIVSDFYGYSAKGYFTADTLHPGKAYWVKVKQNGKLILKGTKNE